MNLTLTRIHFLEDCIIGELKVGERKYFTLERAWHGNRQNISCIPEGDYNFLPHAWAENAPNKFKKVWHIQNVPMRSYILLHAGNSIADTMGCILVGNGVNIRDNTGALLDSKNAINELREIIGRNSGTIKIERVKK